VVPLVAAAVTALAVAGCTAAGGNAASSSLEETNITVAAVPTADLAGLYVALDNGFFAKQGLHVRIEKITSSAAIITDQLNGQVDISAGAYIPYISAQAAGARFRILAEACSASRTPPE
jgi:NitT/TauT family transport system substrate-binding protein